MLARLCAMPGIRHLWRGMDALSTTVARVRAEAAVVAIGLLFLASALGINHARGLARQPPAFFVVPLLPNARAVALDLENRLITRAHDRSPRPWQLDVPDTSLNAWVAQRLPRWLGHNANDTAYQWPETLGDIRFAFENDEVRIAFSLVEPGPEKAPATGPHPRDTIVGATIRPTLRPDGSLWTPATSVQIGQLRIPAFAAFALPKERILPEAVLDRPEVLAMFEALAGRRPLIERADIGLGDGRRVRIESISFTTGNASLTCRTGTASVRPETPEAMPTGW